MKLCKAFDPSRRLCGDITFYRAHISSWRFITVKVQALAWLVSYFLTPHYLDNFLKKIKIEIKKLCRKPSSGVLFSVFWLSFNFHWSHGGFSMSLCQTTCCNQSIKISWTLRFETLRTPGTSQPKHEICWSASWLFHRFLNTGTTGGSLWCNRGLGTMPLGSLEPAIWEILLANKVPVSSKEFCNGENEEKDPPGRWLWHISFLIYLFFCESYRDNGVLKSITISRQKSLL